MADLPPDVLAEVAAGGAADSGGVPVEYLGDFLEAVAAAVAEGNPVPTARLRAYRSLGQRAARNGVALRALLDLYLSAGWRLWRHLPPVVDARRDPDAVVVAGEVMLHAVDDVVAALTEGFQLARRALIRAQESARREFVDDLLTGTADVASLLRRAAGFGLDLAGPHAVAVLAADRSLDDGGPLAARVERAIQGSKGDAPNLVASKDARLVIVFAAPDRDAIEHVLTAVTGAARAADSARQAPGFRVGLGRAGSGADAVLASYGEAVDALLLAGRLGIATPVVEARDLLAYRVLLRDGPALADLVESSLGGLRAARGGAGPLLATLAAFFDAGGNASAAARALHLSVRALTYRLERIRDLTGLDPQSSADRFALHSAVLGARLTGWPEGEAP